MWGHVRIIISSIAFAFGLQSFGLILIFNFSCGVKVFSLNVVAINCRPCLISLESFLVFLFNY